VVEDAATLEHVERPAPNRPVGPWRAGWRRLRRDPWSLSALGAVTLIVLLGLFGGAIVSRLVGHNGTRQFAYAANSNLRPVGPDVLRSVYRDSRDGSVGLLWGD